MSRILRRPMFRGGRVNSRGTGITTGLDRPGMQGGGMPPSGSTFNINMGGRTPVPTGSNIFRPPAVIQPTPTGMSLLERARNIPYLGRLIPSSGGIASTAMGQFILPALGGMAIGKTADFVTRATDTPEAYAFRKEATRANPFLFDETSTDEFIEFSEKLREKDQGEKLGFFPRGGPEARLKEMGLADQFTPEGDRIELPEVLDDLTKNNNKGGAGTGGTGGTGGSKKSTEESLEIDKEKFAKLLGSDKARGQDIADMLLSFSSKALAPEADVKSAFAEFAADEVKRPSRLQKIEDNAAALAINKYIKGEIAKDELNKILALNKAKTDIGDAAYISDALQKSTGFVSGVKQGLQRSRGGALEFVVTDSKSMTEENFKPGPEDIGKIFIEKDTKKVYEFNTNYQPVPIYSG